MSDEECPHGLDPAWCSLCKAAGASGPGRSSRPPSGAPRGRSVGSGPRSARPRTPRATTPRPATPRVPEVPLSPERALARLRPVLFHASAYGAWESIRDSGLRTASKLLADAGHGPQSGPREAAITLDVEGTPAELRDQRVLLRSRIEAHLDGVGLAEWLEILDERVHLFVRQKELTTLLTRYQGEGQDVLVFDTARTLAVGGERVEVATVISASPEPWANCRCRGRDTFVPLALFEGPVEGIEEVTIVGGLEAVAPLVTRVVRHHPDRTTEVVWQRS